MVFAVSFNEVLGLPPDVTFLVMRVSHLRFDWCGGPLSGIDFDCRKIRISVFERTLKWKLLAENSHL